MTDMSAKLRETELRARALEPLPLGSVLPTGWLKNQLRIQADGLSGHLDEFWPDVGESKWIGGNAEGWERGPYWLDGILPLAFLLEDGRLIAKARFWVDTILARQHEDGWFGAKADTHAGEGEHTLDPWPQFVLFKALAQWQEATGDARIVPAMLRALKRIDALLDEKPLDSWAKMRWPDLVVSIHWLYERIGEAETRKWLLALARKAESQGYDWQAHFADFRYTEKSPRWMQENHVVNHAMALKESSVRFRQRNEGNERGMEGNKGGVEENRNETALSTHPSIPDFPSFPFHSPAAEAAAQIATLNKYHGQATGVFSGDESLAGLSPSQGTELCAVVEYLYSLEHLIAAFGNQDNFGFADLWERIAYNALPATFSPDMWAHQYVQQANQVVCKISEDRVYTSNGPEANLYGLEPNFGCCTANMHQGWPKFAAHLWMTAPNDNALVALGYSPCRVHHSMNGVPVEIEVSTDYPFEETVRIAVRIVNAANADTRATVQFPLRLRVPGWAVAPQARIGEEILPFAAEKYDYVEIARDWTGETIVELTLPMRPQILTRPFGAVSVERGPLVYALEIAEEWKQIKGEMPHADWEVYPKSAWNYALRLDPAHPEAALTFQFTGMGARPFSPSGAPTRVQVSAVPLPAWTLENNAAAPPPVSPEICPDDDAIPEVITLLPYGCTNLRVTEFPLCPLKPPDQAK